MADWPATLGYPARYSIEVRSTAQRQITARGFRPIPVATVQKDIITMEWLFTAAQYATYRTFLEDTIKYTDSFTIDVPSGIGYTTQLVVLASEPQEADQYPMMRVLTTFECYDRSVISAAQVDANLA